MEACTYCGNKVVFCENKEIYGRNYGEWPWVYRCTCCDAYVGTHPNSRRPLGTLADRATREARKDAKPLFISLYKQRYMSRTQAYKRLAKEMGIDGKDCHFGMFSIEMCQKAYEATLRIYQSLEKRHCN